VKCFKRPHFEHLHFADLGSDASPTTDEVKNEHHEGNDEQDVNETPTDMKSKSTPPKEQKKNGNN